MENQQRYAWVDRLKFWGILAIYIGHFGVAGGKLYEFVFLYHVPLFYFASGFFVDKTKNISLKNSIIKRVKTLLLPYIVFGLISIIYFSVSYSYSIRSTMQMFCDFLGRRSNMNWFGQMWFLPSLFLTAVLYDALFRIVKNKWTLLGISIVLWYVMVYIISPVKHWFFSADCSILYLPYYCIGGILFEKLNEIEKKIENWGGG